MPFFVAELTSVQLPIIATDESSCRDLIHHGPSGLLVASQDAWAIELAIHLLLDNPHLAHRLGKQARRKVIAEFQVSLVNESTLHTYKRLLGVSLDRKPMLQGLF